MWEHNEDVAAFAMYPYLRSIGQTDIFPAEKWQEKADALEAIFKKRFTPRMRMVISMWNYETRFNQLLKEKVTVPPKCEDLSREQYVDFQEFLCNAAGVNVTDRSRQAVFHVDDPEASDGKALRIDASANWFYQQPLELPPKVGERWKVLVTVKIDTKGLAPNAGIMTVGFYNGKKEFGQTHFYARDFSENKYITVEVPAIDSAEDLVCYIMPRSNSKTRPLFVDRITVVRE